MQISSVSEKREPPASKMFKECRLIFKDSFIRAIFKEKVNSSHVQGESQLDEKMKKKTSPETSLSEIGRHATRNFWFVHVCYYMQTSNPHVHSQSSGSVYYIMCRSRSSTEDQPDADTQDMSCTCRHHARRTRASWRNNILVFWQHPATTTGTIVDLLVETCLRHVVDL